MTTTTKSKGAMLTLTPEKVKEWRTWGKDAYKSTTSVARGNSHHPDYDTPEKIEALHDIYGDSYLLKDERIDALKTKWKYSEEAIKQALESFKAGYDASRKWYAREDAKQQAVIDAYSSIFDEASKIAQAVDVSDIKDGFPCGSAHLYLQQYPEAEDLYKALGHFSGSETETYKRKLPIKTPTYGQCISYDERICKEINEFLRSKGIFASVYSWVD